MSLPVGSAGASNGPPLKASMEPTLISIEGLEKCYGAQKVLSINRLDFPLHGRVTLRGSNGSGKSTLLRLIAGISLPTKGTIRRDLSRLGPRLGYVPQAGGLTDELSLELNLDQRRRLCGLHENKAAKDDLLSRAGLYDSRAKTFEELSGGRQRLAAIAAALYTEPTWLLIDEPLAGVDEHGRAAAELLLAEWSSHTNLLVVTTPESEAVQFAASHIIALRGGGLDASNP